VFGTPARIFARGGRVIFEEDTLRVLYFSPEARVGLIPPNLKKKPWGGGGQGARGGLVGTGIVPSDCTAMDVVQYKYQEDK